MPTDKEKAAVWEHMTSAAIQALERTTETLERVTMMLSVIADRQANARKTVGTQEPLIADRCDRWLRLMDDGTVRALARICHHAGNTAWDYELENHEKEELIDALLTIGHFSDPDTCVGSPFEQEHNRRNKIEVLKSRIRIREPK